METLRENFESHDGRRTATIARDYPNGPVRAEGVLWLTDGTVRGTEVFRFRGNNPEDRAREFARAWVEDGETLDRHSYYVRAGLL